MYGRKDGSQYGLKQGGRGRNRTDVCRNPEVKVERENYIEKDYTEDESISKKVINKILGK